MSLSGLSGFSPALFGASPAEVEATLHREVMQAAAQAAVPGEAEADSAGGRRSLIADGKYGADAGLAAMREARGSTKVDAASCRARSRSARVIAGGASLSASRSARAGRVSRGRGELPEKCVAHVNRWCDARRAPRGGAAGNPTAPAATGEPRNVRDMSGANKIVM